MLSSGSLLDNRYRLDERIATGGMGDVWRGTDVVLGRTIAVKVLRSAMLSDPEFAARFYGEARMMAAFRHPGVVEVYDYSAGDANDEDNCAYLVMAYVDGEPLSARLKEQGRLGVAETMSIVAQAAEALHAAHENGTVHRDVKPGNLIVKPNGTVILVDFGVARSAAVTSVTGLNAIVGTALYMAPEQVAKGNVTPATDVYALGAVAYHCLAGHPPFDGDNALQVALRHLEDDPEPLPETTVPPAVRELISRAMAKHPDDRFADAAEFAAAALAAAGTLDWRSQTGTSMTGTALRRPTMHGPSTTGTALGGAGLTGAGLAGAGPGGAGLTGTGLGQTGTSMSGTSLTRPMSPAAPRRTMPGQRNLLEAAPPVQAPPRKRGRTRNELAVLLTVIGLFILAGGLALAIALQDGNADADQKPNTIVPTESATADDETEAPVEPTETTDAPRPVNPPANTQRPTQKPSPSKSVSTSASTSSSPTPDKTTTPPQTEPATTTPAAPTTEPPPPEGGGGGEDGGGTGTGNN
ncbi:serine/threonine-protein kinase [Actinoplanes sp. NPDC048791]|uniref:serine/threonine-protein kinase n=1 Tax=Actinoplanes sp. NPDC048791 TaxID=3154623 RepID=UPI00340A1E7C